MALRSAAEVRGNLDGSAISTYILYMLIVPLKFWCRHQSGQKNLGLDDILIGLGLIAANAFFYTTMIGMFSRRSCIQKARLMDFAGVRPHLGQHADTLNMPIIIDFLKYVFPAQILYVVALAFIKGSILAFYWRIFAIKARLPLIIGATIVAAWGIGVSLSLVFTCNPVQAQWDLTLTNAVCVSRRAVYLGASVPNVVTDVLLLGLPIPYVWALNAPIFQRIVLVGMFSLGVFVSVVSIVRLSILMGLDLTSPDVTYNLSQVFIWSLVEVNVGIICACLPSLRPAVRYLGFGKLFSSTTQDAYRQQEDTPAPSKLHSHQKSQSSRKKPFGFISRLDDEEEDSFQMIANSNGQYGKNDTSIGTYNVPSRDSEETILSPSARLEKQTSTAMPPIRVDREWRIESRTPERIFP